jgi:hypothetical protein
LQYLVPHVVNILSDAESVRILSAAFFVLVSYVTISTSRQPKDSVITPDALNDFCLELIRSCSPETPGGHKPPVAGTTTSPQAARLSEIVVDVFWMLDSELEDASVEEARAPASGSEPPSALQTRATVANAQRTEDRQRMVELIRRLLVSTHPTWFDTDMQLTIQRPVFSTLIIVASAWNLYWSPQSRHYSANHQQ